MNENKDDIMEELSTGVTISVRPKGGLFRNYEIQHPLLVVLVLLVIALTVELFLGCQSVQNLTKISENEQRIIQLEQILDNLKESYPDAELPMMADTAEILVSYSGSVPISKALKSGCVKKLPLSSDISTVQLLSRAKTSINAQSRLYAAAEEITSAQMQYQSGELNSNAIRALAESIDKYFGEDDKDCRVPWYYGEESCAWKFVPSVLPYSDYCPVIWIGQNESGRTVAICTAFWDVTNEVFVQVEYVQVGSGLSSVESESPDLTPMEEDEGYMSDTPPADVGEDSASDGPGSNTTTPDVPVADPEAIIIIDDDIINGSV